MATSGAPAARYDEWADWYEAYVRRERRFGTWNPHGVRARVGAAHLPVGDLLNALTAAGLSIERVAELGRPVPDILAVRCGR
jgi:hypothetical protein